MCLVRRSAWVVPNRAYIPIPNLLRSGQNLARPIGRGDEIPAVRRGECGGVTAQDARTSSLRVVSSVNVSDSFGMLVTNGPTIQPKPVGIPRVKETDSH